MDSGDRLVLFTDGITEARRPHHVAGQAEFEDQSLGRTPSRSGEARLIALAVENRGCSAPVLSYCPDTVARGDGLEKVREQIERRLHRHVDKGQTPEWLQKVFDDYFKTWRVDEDKVDITDLTEFEQEALTAAARIPPGQVRSYAWVAQTIGRPKAARAVGQAMARNPLPLFFPCHRVVDSTGALHNYGYGIEMKARLLTMEGYRPQR